MRGVLDEVRRASAEIAANARLVRIRHDRIAAYASGLPLEQVRAPQLDAETHYLKDADGTLAYLLQLDAINFGSGYFPHLRKRVGLSGCFTVAASWKDHFEAHGPMSAHRLQQLTQNDCARIFGQEPRPDPAIGELMGLFARALRDLGEYVDRTCNASFRKLVENASGSAEQLVGILAAMPFYQDVPFYKRAQLTAADLATAGVATFSDLERLTIFADNLVPHVLRLDGVLDYDADLLARINREDLIPADSQEEREMRGCAVHAVELIREVLGNAVTAMQLDYLLWNRGQLPAYKAIPRHRARTVYY